jgi:hypothetical protein
MCASQPSRPVTRTPPPPIPPHHPSVLRACLPDKGFTAHVIGFTVAAVLAALNTRCEVHGHLDSSVPLILPLIENDLFGQVSEAKEATNFASAYKEAKRCRAYEAYQLLAASVSFSPEAMEQLLSLVREKLPAASGPAVRGKLQQLLQHAARGVAANPSAGGAALAEFLRALLEGCVGREEAARARAKAAVTAANSVAPKGAPPLVGPCACLPSATLPACCARTACAALACGRCSWLTPPPVPAAPHSAPPPQTRRRRSPPRSAPPCTNTW